MNWKTTGLLLLAAIGLGAYISLYEIRQPPPEEREQLSEQVLAIPADSVTQLVLEFPQAKVTLTLDHTTWKLSPRGLRADESVISQLLDHTASVIAERRLSGTPEHPLDLNTFGLEPGIGRLTLTAKGTETTLLFGDLTPVNNNRYMKVAGGSPRAEPVAPTSSSLDSASPRPSTAARDGQKLWPASRGRPEIYVVSSQLFDDANRPQETFRDRHLIRLNAWELTELAVTSPVHSFALQRNEEAWNLTRPIADRAERTAVNTLVNSLSKLEITRVLDEEPTAEQLSPFGLDQPTAQVTVLASPAPSPITLLFGKPLAEDQSLVYAKRTDEPFLYAVSGAEVDALVKDPKSLRAMRCFDFFTANVRKVEMVREGTTWMLTKTDGQWHAEGTDKTLDTPRVEELLQKLAGIRLIEFVNEAPSDVARYGLAPPFGSIAIWTLNHDQPQRLLIGTPIEDSTDRHGSIEGRTAIIRLPALAVELTSTTGDQLTAPPPSTQDTTPPVSAQ